MNATAAKHLCGMSIAAATLAFVPAFGNDYHVVLLFQILMFVALSGSWNLITGITGYLSFGHVAYFGTGAYCAAILMTKAGFHWVSAAACGGVAAACLALIIGAICLRLRGHYFSIATFGLNEVVRVAVLIASPLTNGAVGISLPLAEGRLWTFYAMLAVALATVLSTYLILNSNTGLRLIAIREDEDAARVYGIPTTLLKISAFALSAFLAGLVGGIYAYDIGYIEPRTVFLPMLSLQMIVFALFGGKGTVLGPVIGTACLFMVWELLWINLPFVHLVGFGVVTIAIVLYMPDGVVGMISRLGYSAIELRIPVKLRLRQGAPSVLKTLST